MNSDSGARWSIQARQISCDDAIIEEKDKDDLPVESLTSLAEVCGAVTVARDRPRRSTGRGALQWRSVRALLWREIRRRKARMLSGRSLAGRGRLLFGRLVGRLDRGVTSQIDTSAQPSLEILPG